MYDVQYHKGNLDRHHFLVTGGAGFIGSHLVEYLLKNNAGRVRVLDNLSTGKMANLEPFLTHPGFEWMEGDIRDEHVCREACSDVHFVLHQAALGSVPRSIEDPLATNDVNIGGFLRLLDAARRAGTVRKMVYAASSSTYGDSPQLPKKEENIGRPLSPYAVTKYVNELYGDIYSRVYGFHTTGLRYFNVFGPRQDPNGPYAAVIPLFMKAALSGTPPFINGDGNQTRDFTFVENAVQANIRAIFEPRTPTKHEVFNVACGKNISLNELWNLIAAIAGSTIAPVYRGPRAGDIRDSLADIAKAREAIGYEPLFDINKGISITYEWYEAQSKKPNA